MNTPALLTKQFLSDIGVALSPEEEKLLEEHFEQTLTNHVIEEIIDELDEEQLQQLHEYRHRSDEELQAWLRENIPQLTEIITDEVAILLGEIAENSDKL